MSWVRARRLQPGMIICGPSTMTLWTLGPQRVPAGRLSPEPCLITAIRTLAEPDAMRRVPSDTVLSMTIMLSRSRVLRQLRFFAASTILVLAVGGQRSRDE